MSITKLTYLLITLVLSFIILKELQDFIIPLIFAVIIWLLIRKVRRWILEFATKIPYWAGTVLATIFISAIIMFSFSLIGSQAQEFTQEETINFYSERGESMWNSAKTAIGEDMLVQVEERIEGLDFGSFARNLVGSLSSLFGSSFMVLLYLVFLLLEENLFRVKLNAIYPNKARREQVVSIIKEIIESVESYITLKTVVSLITAAACYIALLILGVDFAFFWAILIFLLNYIPTVGSLIATLFPAVVALIEFESFQMFGLVLLVLGVIQLIVGNIIEPRVMGNSLNISPLVVLISLTLWQMIWGTIGMILSVPIMVILIIIFSKIPSTRNVAIWLSGTGKINKQT